MLPEMFWFWNLYKLSMFMLPTYMHPLRCASTTHFWGVECAIPSGLFGLRIKNSAVHYPRGSLHKKDYATEHPHLLSSQDWEIHCIYHSFDLSRSVKKCHDNTKGRHKGLLKDTKNHSSMYHGPSLILCIRIAQKGDPKGHSRTLRITLQCTMAQV